MARPWSLEPEDRIDAGFVLECLEPVGRRILSWLAERPGEPVSFGRVPLVDVDDRTCVISGSGALVVPVALGWLAESAELQRMRGRRTQR